MKNKFLSKNKIKKLKIKILFILIMTSLGIFINYKVFENSKIKLKDKEVVDLIVNNTFNNNNTNLIEKLIDKTLEVSDPIKLLNKDYNAYLLKEEKEEIKEEVKEPVIYLYNTHQTEEYKTSELIDFTISPTVMINDYILEDIFNKNNYLTLVEESSISDILNDNNWKYVNSYKASRILMEQSIIKYPSLKYFIDIHRDSLTRDKTTIEIEGKNYAKIIFIVGLENNNYQENLSFTEKINNKLDEYYPNLSKGIYKKEGAGVNGIYNQDFSKYTILIEIGGYENTTSEVLNTALAFSKCFLEVINEENI